LHDERDRRAAAAWQSWGNGAKRATSPRGRTGRRRAAKRSAPVGRIPTAPAVGVAGWRQARCPPRGSASG